MLVSEVGGGRVPIDSLESIGSLRIVTILEIILGIITILEIIILRIISILEIKLSITSAYS